MRERFESYQVESGYQVTGRGAISGGPESRKRRQSFDTSRPTNPSRSTKDTKGGKVSMPSPLKSISESRSSPHLIDCSPRNLHKTTNGFLCVT